jgi:hypothetical protein
VAILSATADAQFPGSHAPHGSIIGRIELVPGVPMRSCDVLLTGPKIVKNTKCDNEGRFSFDYIQIHASQTGVEGILDLRVTGEWLYDKKSPIFPVGMHNHMITNVGTLIVSHYGAIHGQVINADPEHLAGMLVTAEWFGIAAKPDARGYYVLDRVPPGDYNIILHNVWYGPYPTLEKRVVVKPKATTKKVDFVLTPPPPVRAVAPTAPDSPTAKVGTPTSQVPLASAGKQVTPTAKVAPITIFNISGQWQSSIGLTYNITQQQNNFQWTVAKSTEKGSGTLKGYDVNASWQEPKGRGSSPGKITEVDPRGRATKIIWDNGVQFYR